MVFSAFTTVSNLAFLTNIRGSQLFIIIFVVLLLFGTKRLPAIARNLGKAIREFRKSASTMEKEFRQAMDDEKPEGQIASHESCTTTATTTEQAQVIDDKKSEAKDDCLKV